MTENKPSLGQSVPSDVYTREYYESGCDGYERFNLTKGAVLPPRLKIPFDLAEVAQGMVVVDVGCGRGEIIFQCAKVGAIAWGIDYAREAIYIAKENIVNLSKTGSLSKIGIQQSSATSLPFADNSVDLVFMLDIVEHLYPNELTKALNEIWRILKPGGRLIVHTMPNLWYYKFGYPLYRLVERLRGKRIPKDPRDRWPFRHVHVNEQTPSRLKNSLKISRFEARVWLKTTQVYSYESNRIIRSGMYFFTHVYPFSSVFCNDIFAVGVKKWPASL